MVVTARRRLTADQREQQLLDVAEGLFTEHGFEGVSVEDIAQAAGISRPIVYQHHGSREGIFVACVRRARDEFEATMTASAPDVSGGIDTALAAGGRVFFELIQTNPRRWVLLFSSSASLGGQMAQQLIELREHTVERIADITAPYAPNLNRSMHLAAAHVISGIGEQLGRWWMTHPDISIDEVTDMYVAAVGGAVRALFELEPEVARPEPRRRKATQRPSTPTATRRSNRATLVSS